MTKRPTLLTLLWLSVLAVVLFWSGCSSEEEKRPVVNDPPVVEAPETASQKPDPGIEKPTSEPENVPPKVEEAATIVAEKPEELSKDKTSPAEIVIFANLWDTHTKGGVKLTHANHVQVHKISCSECHHVYEDGKNVWDESMPVAKCETCHNEPTVKKEKTLPPEEQKKNLKLAFHNNCRGCHKKIKKENPETKAPLKCSQCHEKQD